MGEGGYGRGIKKGKADLRPNGVPSLNPRTTFLSSPSSSVFFSFSSTGLSFFFGRFFPLPYGVLILAVTLYPAFSWTAQLLGGRRKLAALIVTAISLLVFTGPIIWLGLSMIEGVASFSHRLATGDISIPPSLRGDQVLAIYWRPRLLFLGPGRYEHKTGH